MENKKYANLREKAYDIIKNKIISCKLMPGDPVSEQELIGEIGASRTPIREALSKLENENLVRIYPKRGVFVTDVSIKDVIDIYNVREVIEPLAARLATDNIRLNELEKYEDIYGENKTVDTVDFDLEEHIRIDREFHTLIAQSTDNSYLAQMLMGIYDKNSRIRILSKLRESERKNEARLEHMKLIRLFRMRDAQGAEEAMKQHIINGRKIALKVVSM